MQGTCVLVPLNTHRTFALSGGPPLVDLDLTNPAADVAVPSAHTRHKRAIPGSLIFKEASRTETRRDKLCKQSHAVIPNPL
eukprot:1160222-Pelagomonas_calceolata.AAC.13